MSKKWIFSFAPFRGSQAGTRDFMRQGWHHIPLALSCTAMCSLCLSYKVPLQKLDFFFFFFPIKTKARWEWRVAYASPLFFPTPPRPVTWYTPNMVITPSSVVNEQEGKHDECVTRRLRIFGVTFATPRHPPSVRLAANLVEEAMTDDSAEIEPALLGNNCL